MKSKTSIRDLAFFGGAPSISEKLHVGRPNIGSTDRLYARMDDILSKRWLTNMGPYVHEFEKEICDHTGVNHCITVCNATLGLQLAIRALGLQGEVILPSFTFIASAHALEWQGITPVFCDIDPQTHNINPRKVEELITPRTTGILGVHIWGRPCAVEELQAIADQHQLALFFDAAHAFTCSYQDRMIGNFGSVEVFSFHATKFLNTFEGGLVATNDSELADRVRLMSNFGFAGYDQVMSPGINAKMSEISAAMGLTGLESMDEFRSVNYHNYQQYLCELDNLPGVSMIIYDEGERNNYQYVISEIDDSITRIHRDQVVELLWAENILARRYFYPGCHKMAPYRTNPTFSKNQLIETERLVERVILLPTGTSVETDDIHTICQMLRFIISNGDQISELIHTGKSH